MTFTGLIGLLLIEGCSSGEADLNARKTAKLPTVQTDMVRQESISNRLDLTGTVVATRVARIASPGEGPVLDCIVREGDRLTKGTQVAAIGRSQSAEAKLAAARQLLKEQESELERIRQLKQQELISSAEFDLALSKYESANAQFIAASESVGDYFVTAPWDGIVSKVHVADGDYVAPRAPLIEMFDPASLVIQSTLPESRAISVHNGLKARLKFDAYPDREIEGSISRVYPDLNAKIRTRTFELVPSEAIQMIPGMFVRINLSMEIADSTVIIPQDAIVHSSSDTSAVFVVSDGVVQRRTIQTGIEEGTRLQVLSGLIAGEIVVIAGHEALENGMKVRVIDPQKESGRPESQLPSVESKAK
jgi:membrane fusion protein (multidrug efflux system)